MKIVTISGLDGSGKSTQLSLLKDYLEDKNYNVYIFHVIEFSILNKIKNKFKKSKKTQNQSITNSSYFGIVLRKIFFKVDSYRFKKLVRKLTKNEVDFIIADRYFYDSAVNISYLENSNKFLNFIDPVTTYKFFLDVAPEDIMNRPRKPDQGIDYLNEKDRFIKNIFALMTL